MQSRKSAIVVVVDRLGSAHLGPYGNTWIETPALNRLASQSCVWENAFSDTPSLPQVYRSYWQGTPAIRAESVVEHPPWETGLPRLLASAGVHATLLTDSPWLGEAAAESDFERIEMSQANTGQMATNVGQTQFGRLAALAIEWLSHSTDPSLLWLHAQAAESAWDAPFLLRDQFTEDGDPPPSDCVIPPNLALAENPDPDQLLAFSHAYAGQVVAVDTCIGALLRKLEEFPQEDQPLLILTAPRGYPLGEHGYVGAGGDDLYSEVLQVPLLLRFPEEGRAARRKHDFAQPADLHATLLDFFQIDATLAGPRWGNSLLAGSPRRERRQYCCAVDDQNWAIRTPMWFLRESSDPQLFVKPDDRWEVNEVASRCEDIVAMLRETIVQVRSAAQRNDPEMLPSLAAELIF